MLDLRSAEGGRHEILRGPFTNAAEQNMKITFVVGPDDVRIEVVQPKAQEGCMSVVDELVENLVERNVIKLNGALTISLVDGGLSVRGRLLSTLRDQKKGKDLLNVEIPVDAQLKVSDVVLPLPQIR